jgi:hypothetical protein
MHPVGSLEYQFAAASSLAEAMAALLHMRNLRGSAFFVIFGWGCGLVVGRPWCEL